MEYRWDFDGDGVYDTDWSKNEFIEHTYGYGYKGIQRVTVQVKDPENSRDEYTREVEILENTVPVAVLDVEPKVGTFDTMFRFTGEKSYDDETPFSDLEFRWDKDYNGPNDIIFESNFSRSHYRQTFKFDEGGQKTGRHKVRMEVKDKDGRIGSAVSYITIHWASPYLKMLNDEKITFTRYDRFFDPNKPVPRGQVVQMIVQKIGINIFNTDYEEIFSDVPRYNKYSKHIVEAAKLGIVEGYPDGTFRPEEPISRSETLAMILRAFQIDILGGGFQFYPDVPKDQWVFKYVDTGPVHGRVSGYETGKFGPHDPITFGEIAKILYQAGELNKTN